MSAEASGGGASVGRSDRSGGNNVCDECSIRMDQIIEESSGQRFSDEEKKTKESSDQRFNEEEKKIEESNDQRFNKEGKKQFDSFNDALEAVNPKIQKVPSMLRKNQKLEAYFEPKVFSFGPYNHSRCTHKMAKQIKANLAAEFLQQNGVEKGLLHAIIENQIKEFKDCYDDELTKDYEDDELASMFLVDGCAILQFMQASVDSEKNPNTQFKKLGIKNDYAVFLIQDLLLLENQLPYKLLQLIIQHHKKDNELLESIYKFINYYFRAPSDWNKNREEILKDLEDNHVHFLDLLRKKLIQPLPQIDEKRDLIEIINNWTVVLFEKLEHNRNEFDLERLQVPLRNIGKLREAGINLKRSKTSRVDISFSGGTLKLPRIIVGESSARLFLNMLGYEMCPDFQNEFEVSTYLYLMDKLIDRTQDVEEFQEKNILLNQLGSDEEVVMLFNGIGTHLIPNFDRYFEVKNNIDNYFDNKGLIWIHKVFHDIHKYFKRRWSLLAFIAALLAVASTIIQTVITVLVYQADSKKGI